MILSSHTFNPEALLHFLNQQFAEKDWFYMDMDADDEVSRSLKASRMGFYLLENDTNTYPQEINLTETDEEIIADYQFNIAKALSAKYQIKTVIDFKHPEEPDNPFYSLLFDKGDCFLADDSTWEEDEAFVIVKPWL